jgi:hypothetical protein
MDVGNIQISVHPAWPAASGERLFQPDGQGASAPTEVNFDYNQVMMDLEEVKNFLYMVVGGGSLKLRQDERVGTAVDKRA